MELGHEIKKIAGKLLSPVRAGDGKLAEAKERAFSTLRVTTTAFTDGGPIPGRHAGEKGVAPSLAWGAVPGATREIVVLCEDPDAPFPKPFSHWVVFGLAPTTDGLAEGLTADSPLGGAKQGKNSAGTIGFTGPKPPVGHGIHHYHFQVFALDAPLDLPADADRDDLVKAMHGHVLASGEVVGTYEVS